MKKSIGGYFELELDIKSKLDFHSDLIALNTARNCFEYILLKKKYDVVHIPYFTCDVLLEPLNKHKISYKFYDVNDDLEPILDFDIVQKNEVVLLTNYFGLKSNFIENIVQKKVNFIVDNSQAYFTKPIIGIDAFYSPRKFFGVADGGYLYTDTFIDHEFEIDRSYERISHLIKRIELGAENGYADFKRNDASLENQPIKKMSFFTSKILNALDYESIASIRQKNYRYLHDHLKHTNKLQLPISDFDVPMIYPYRIENANGLRERLIQNKIFCATYWPNVYDWCKEEYNSYHLTSEIIAIPIDQRYDIDDMKRILSYV